MSDSGEVGTLSVGWRGEARNMGGAPYLYMLDSTITRAPFIHIQVSMHIANLGAP